MNTQQSFKRIVASLFLLIFQSSFLLAQELGKGEGPYFHLQGDAEVEAFPLKKTNADAKIVNSIAYVTVEQTYINEGSKPIEAIYVFPGSTSSAIHDLKMRIGDRIIQAKISEKQEARKNYEQAKSDGKSASLLEQHRPNVFQMNVANIMPGDVIQVTLKYTELLAPVNGEYTFVFPTVVGPRYQSADVAAADGEQWNKNPYLKKNKPVPYEFALKTNLQSAVPIASASCKSHDATVQFTGKNTATVQLNKSDEGNRDFVLKYRLQGDKIESGLMVYPQEKESFFMAVIEPPAVVKKSDVTPREFIFVLDISGSMNGFPIEISKQLITGMIDDLSEKDYFNILTFAGTSMVFSEKPSQATVDAKNRAKNFVNSRNSGGGTELLPALRKVFSMPKTEGLSRSIVIATDGYITVERECFELIDKESRSSNIHTFGIGTSVNRYLLEGMGKIGKGYHTVITDGKDAKTESSKFRKHIEQPLLTDIKVSVSGAGKVDLEPAVIGDLLAGRPIVIAGKVDGMPSGILKVEGKNGGEKFERTFNYSNALVSKDYEALKYLWARKRIQRLDDWSYMGKREESKDEVLALGLAYNLLTAYTSFLAVDNDVRNKDKQYASVHQPLPLPHRVEESAVMQNLSGVSMSYRSVPTSVVTMDCLSVREQDVDYNTTTKTTYKAGDLLPPHKREKVASEKAMQSDDVMRNPYLEKKEDKKLSYFRLVSPLEKVTALPEFGKGRTDFDAYIKKNLKYPEAEKKSGKKGNVVLIAEIDEQGKMVAVIVKKGLGDAFDKEAIRIIKTMPAWKPAQYAGRNIICKVELLVNFAP